MENISLQQYYRQQMEEKQREDEYFCLLEDTARNVQQLKLQGKSRLAYLKSVYRENRRSICRYAAEQNFLSAVLSDVRKK